MAIRPDEEMIVNGRLTQIGFSFRHGTQSTRSAVFQCSCGSKKVMRRDHVKHGKSGSCGCLHFERMSTSGGESKHELHGMWMAMIRRCCDENHVYYKSYGGRGISVCDRWLNSFSLFVEDVGDRPDGMTLDRVDNNGNYEPGNVKWSTRKEQSRNRRDSRILTVDGESRCLEEWSEISGIGRTTIRQRLRRGWSDSESVTVPVGERTRWNS